MIKKYLTIAFLGSASLALISAGISETTSKIETYKPLPTFSGGPGTGGLGDRTGSPLSSATCTACHSGGSFGASLSMQLLENGVPVTSYTAGNTYTIEYTVSGTSNGFGFQGTALTSSNSAGGSFSSPSAGSQTPNLSGVSYFEHLGVSSSGNFQATWTAPAANSGSINFYGVGLAVNQNGSTSGDQVTNPEIMTITESVVTTVNYPGNPYCGNDTDEMPVINGNSAGTFISDPGLSINATTGEVDISASSPGTYNVTYTHTSGTTSTSVTIFPTYTTSTTELICSDETLTFGTQTLDASNAGLNIETFQSMDGCDSTVNLTLMVETIDITTTLNGETITANQSGATYQWLDCDNGNTAIAGATNMSYTPMVSGNYAVEITLNNCVETSSCVLIDVASTNDFSIESIVVYPNPVVDVLEIKNIDQFGKINSITLIDANGRIVNEIPVNSTSMNLGKLDSGIYYLRINSDLGVSTISVMKK